MRILILGAGKMGSFFTDVLSFQHETAVFDVDPKLLFTKYCPLSPRIASSAILPR